MNPFQVVGDIVADVVLILVALITGLALTMGRGEVKHCEQAPQEVEASARR